MQQNRLKKNKLTKKLKKQKNKTQETEFFYFYTKKDGCGKIFDNL